VKGRRASSALGLLLLTLSGCAKPAQLGGLGVFNPKGLEGRMALARKLKAPAVVAAEQSPSAGVQGNDQRER
jgi:hypothetical protein